MDFVKAILKDMIEPRRNDSGVSVAAIAARMGTAPSTLYGYTNNASLPALQVPAVTTATGNTELIRALCEHCGGLYVPAPAGRDVEHSELRHSMREFAELVEATCEALEDGRITTAEADRVEREGHEAIAAIYGLLAEVRARADAARNSDGRVARLRDTQERRRGA